MPSGGSYIAEVKWRNQLLALFCLLVFAAFGVLYFRHWVVQKPFGIILFIGEGLSADRLAALRVYAGNAETPLTLDTFSQTALLKNYSADSAIPDRAAAATALATGVKVNNGLIGVDADGKTLANLLELARASGRTTGLVTDARLTNPTAAAFYAHTSTPGDAQELARTLVESAKIDIVLGGGSAEFLPETDGGARSDARDLLTEAGDAGYDVVRTRTELDSVAWWRWPKVFGVFGVAELEYGDEIGPDTPQPSLSEMVRRAIELLQIHRGGYLLVVDAALMRKAAEQNETEETLAAMAELDRAISVALRFSGTKTAVFVCGDVAVGGLAVGAPLARSAGKPELLGNDSLGARTLTWSTGPNGPGAPVPEAPRKEPDSPPIPEGADLPQPQEPPDIVAAEQIAAPVASAEATATAVVDPLVEASPSPEASPMVSAERSQPAPTATAPAAVYAPAALNQLEDVIAFGHRTGSEALHGTLENTAIFTIIRGNL